MPPGCATSRDPAGRAALDEPPRMRRSADRDRTGFVPRRRSHGPPVAALHRVRRWRAASVGPGGRRRRRRRARPPGGRLRRRAAPRARARCRRRPVGPSPYPRLRRSADQARPAVWAPARRRSRWRPSDPGRPAGGGTGRHAHAEGTAHPLLVVDGRRTPAAAYGCGRACPRCRPGRSAGSRAMPPAATCRWTRGSWWTSREAETLTLTRSGRVVMREKAPGVGSGDGRRGPRRPADFYVRNKLTRYRSPGIRADRLRHQRAIAHAHRLAGRRLHRHPRQQSAPDPSGARVARVHPPAQRRHTEARRADAGGNASFTIR